MSGAEPKVTPYQLWKQANDETGGGPDSSRRTQRYVELMRDHGLLMQPGDEGYEDGVPWPHLYGEGDYGGSS